MGQFTSSTKLNRLNLRFKHILLLDMSLKSSTSPSDNKDSKESVCQSRVHVNLDYIFQVIHQKNDFKIVFQPKRLCKGKKLVCQSRVYVNLDYIFYVL